MNRMPNDRWLAFGLSFLALLFLVGIGFSGYGLKFIPSPFQDDRPEIFIPVLIMVGGIGLLIALSFLSTALAGLGLSDRNRAIALPPGSIRALIALLLVTLFAIAAIFLFRELNDRPDAIITQYIGITQAQLADIPSDQIIALESTERRRFFNVTTTGAEGRRYTGISQEERDDIPDEEISTIEVITKEVFNATRRIDPPPADEDSIQFAFQILTTVATLVVAVAGFYFGTRAVQAAEGVAGPSRPRIRHIDPDQGRQGQEYRVTIRGREFESPITVELVRAGAIMRLQNVRTSPTSITGMLQIPADAEPGAWDLVVVNDDGEEAQLQGAFTVRESEDGGAGSSNPVVQNIDPSQGRQGQVIDGVTIRGREFESSATVELVREDATVQLEEIQANPTGITGTLRIPADAAVGAWDLRVENSDGGEARLEGAFTVNEA